MREAMNWLDEATGTQRDEYYGVISLAQTFFKPNSGNDSYQYAASFALGCAAASAYLYFANKNGKSHTEPGESELFLN